MYGSKAPQGTHYYCRGCGEKLPSDCHAQFHPECLKADKRRRTHEKRRLEQERLLACGSAMQQVPKRRRREASPLTPGSPSVRRAA